MSKKTMKVPTLQMRAMVSEGSLNEENRSVDITWTTGSKGLRRSFGGDYYEELSLDPMHVDMSRINDSAPLLAAHDDSSLDSVVGVVERAWLEGDKGGATVRFASDEISQRVFTKVKEKILRNISVGYSVSQYTDVSMSGDSIPTLRATRWQPMELSIVPIGFDAGAKVRNSETLIENEVELIARSEETPPEETVVMSDKATSAPVDTEALVKEAATQERQRASDIRTAVRAAKLEDTFADELVERGVTADEARKQVLAKLAAAPAPAAEVSATIRAEVGATHESKVREGIEGALMHRLDSSFKLDDNAKRFAGRNLVRMAEEILGSSARGLSESEIVKRAMSTSDFPLALANVAEKSAARQYALAPSTFESFVNRDELRNYKPTAQIKSGDFSSLDERQEGGEFKYGSMGESQETAQLKDYGKVLRLTKQLIINDDLGIFKQVISKGGVAGKRKESQLVYNVLLNNPTMSDGVALFHASHGNLLSASAINQTGMAAAMKALRAMTTIDGEDNLELTARTLVVGPDKEAEARAFLQTITANQTSQVNIYANSLDLVVENRITGNKWFVIADKAQVDTITLFGLQGQSAPVIETRTRWEDSSVEFKVEHTVTAAAMDSRGMIYNPGA